MTLHRLQLWLGGLVVVVAVATASPVLQNDLTQDDVPLVREDARIHDLGNIREILTTPFWPEAGATGHHRPMTTLTLAVEWAHGWGIHRDLQGHVADAARRGRLGTPSYSRSSCSRSGGRWPSALAFAVHPVHVEAVAVAINQAELIIGARLRPRGGLVRPLPPDPDRDLARPVDHRRRDLRRHTV